MKSTHMRCRLGLLVVGWLLCACGKDAHKTDAVSQNTTGAQTAPAAASAPAEALDASGAGRKSEESADAGNAGSAGNVAVVADEGAFKGAVPKSAKSIGHTSVVFKVDFSNGQRAAWKPRSKRGKTRYRGEIAAYRLARALGLVNVPLAFPFRIARDDLNKVVQGKDAAMLEAEAIGEPDGTIRGALIPWIPKLEFYAIESEKNRAEWEQWLFAGVKGDEVPAKYGTIAADISTVIAFDLITGNWDRFSGGNVGANGPGGHLLFIDNDGAFFDPVPPGPLARQTALLQRTERFSKSFIEALRKLDADALTRAIGEDAPGEPLLPTSTLKGILARKTTVLTTVDKKIAADGEPAVLYFP